MDIADYANETPQSVRISPVGDYLSEADLASPVDMYYTNITSILRYGAPTTLNESDFVGRLLVVGVVSSAEAYFRAVLSTCIEMCPVAQAVASKQSIHLGGLLWHGSEGFSRSAFEHASFASKDALADACRKFLGVTLEEQTFKSLLDEFEVVCHLRHGIVHSDGLLPGRNAVLLDIPRYRKPVRIVIRYEQLHEVTAVVNTLVMTLNRHLFGVMCKRWAIDWRQRADWDPLAEAHKFNAIWSLFHCKEEAKRRKGRSRITKRNCLAEVRATYNV